MATKTNSQRLKELRKKREEESKSSSSSSSSYKNSDRVKKLKLERDVGFDTFETDLKNMGATISSIYGGWQTQETMANTKTSVEAMQKRIDAYQTYQKKYGGTDLSEVASGYKSVLDDWDNLSSVYGYYQNADAYNKALQNARFDNQFRVKTGVDADGNDTHRGLTYDEVQAKKKEYDKGSAEYDYLSNYTNYTSYADFDKALKEAGYGEKDKVTVKGKASSYLEGGSNLSSTPYGAINSASKAEKKEETYLDKLEKASNIYKLDNIDEKWLAIAEEDDFAETSKYEKGNSELYEYINNVDGARANILYAHDKIQANSPIYTPSRYTEMGLDAMTDEEIGIYNTLYAQDKANGTNRADEYLKDIETVLTKRISDKQREGIKSAVDDEKYGALNATLLSLASPVMSVGGGIYGAVENVSGLLTGEGGNPYSIYNSASNMASDIRTETGENIAESTQGMDIFGVNVPQFLYNTGMSMADSGLGLLSLGKTFTPLMGMNAYQQTAKELTEAGENADTVNKLALANGVAEALFEYVSIDKLLKINNIDGVKSWLKATAKQAGIEASEEILTETSNIIFDGLIRGNGSDLGKLKQDLINRGYSEEEAETEALKQAFSQVAQAGIGGALSGGVMGGAFGAVQHHDLKSTGAELRANDRTQDIMSMFTPEEAEAYKVYSEYAGKGVTADNITDAQLGNLYATKEAGAVDTLKSRKSTTEQKESAVRTLDALSTYRSTPNTKLKATGEKVDIEGMKKVDGETVLVTSGGEVSTKDVTLSTNHAELLSHAESMSEEKANLFLEQYDGTSNVEAYKDSFEMAYAYGETGFGADSVLNNRGVLTEAQASEIYKRAITNKVAVQQKAIDDINAKYGKAVTVAGKFDDSIIDYNNTTTDGNKVNWNALTSRQRDAITFAKGFSEATGVNIKFIKSDVVGGKRVGKNGSYNPETNTIEIDVYAGVIDASAVNDSIIPTISHEVTHWMKAKAPAMYSKMREHIMGTLAMDGKLTSEERVAQEMERIQKNHPDAKVTEEMAIDEIMARACEDMLSNSDTARKMLSRMSKKEQNSFVAKVKETFENLMQWVNDLLGKYKSTSKEAEMLRQYKDRLKQLSKMWDTALAEASQTNQSLQNEGITGEEAINRATQKVGVAVDLETESAYPSEQLSERTWTESEYLQNKEVAVKALAKAIGVTKADAERYINNINSIAKMIADDRARLDYEPNLDEYATVLKTNKEYKWTVDMSTLCAKRLLFTGTFDAIQKALPNTAFNSDDIVGLRSMMMSRGYEVACGICYVESTRRELGTITADFIERYKLAQKTGKPISKINSKGEESVLRDRETKKDLYADKDYTPTLAELNTTDIDLVKINHPDVYSAYMSYMKARGQAIPKLLETRAEYKGEILKHFNKSAVKSRNDAGGLRVQSFSDFEVAHLIDMMQVVLDMSRVGLMSQAYTKVPAFAEVFGDTGIKINLSLIAKDSGIDENGNLIFDDVEGINHNEAFRLRDKYSKNVGTILVGKSDEHIIKAMADPRIDFIIPFHKSFWKESLYDALGLTGYSDYTDTQNEKPIDKNRKIKNFQPSEYWDYSKTGDENAQVYLQMCKEDGRIPKFPQFQGYEGYWKLLIDFKMYDNDGVGSPQIAVQPNFNMDGAMEILNSYEGGHRSFPVAEDVVNDFVKEYKKNHPKEQYSDREDFSMVESVEQKRDLVAMHNMSPSQLSDALKRNGLLAPSLAVTNKGHTEFGDISLLFAKETIDPSESTDNKLYGADAWTPTQTALKKNAKFDVNKTTSTVRAIKKSLGKYASELFSMNSKQFSEAIAKADGSIYDSFAYNDGMQTAYAIEKGLIDEIPTKNGKVDMEALHEALDTVMDTDAGWRAYKIWLNDISDNIITSYDKATNEDILKNMKKQPSTAKNFKLSLNGDLVVPASEYDSIDTLRGNKNRLSENAEVEAKAVASEMIAWANEINKISGVNAKNVVNAINKSFAHRYDAHSIVQAFNGRGINITSTNATELQSLYKRAVELPTQYFEAKPQREVSLNEIKAVVMPKQSSYKTDLSSLHTSLQKLGIPVIEYTYGDKASRVQALNSVDEIKFSDRDSEGTQLTKEQIEFFKDSKVRDEDGNLRVVYHGSEADFTVFDRTKARANMDIQGSFFSPWDIDAGGYGGNVRAFYLNIKNPASESMGYKALRKFQGQNGAGIKAREYLESLGYDGVNNGDEEYIAFYPEQIKLTTNTNPTEDADIRYSDRDNVSIYDLMGENKTLKKQNAKLEEDVNRLKERLKLEKQVTHGNTFNANQLHSVAKHLRKSANSTYAEDTLVEELRDVYSYIVESPQIDWTDLMSKCYEVAKNVLNESKGYKVTNDYFKSVLEDIRRARITLSDEQVQEAKSAYGEKYRNAFMGRVMLVKDGTSLDQKWQEWAYMYPEIFDENVIPANQITELSDIYDALKEGAENYQKFNDAESIRAFAVEIYNQYWNVSTIRTTADKYDKQIKRLNFEHRTAMNELRADYKKRVEDQKKADAIHYGKMISDIRKRRDADVKQAKELGKKRLDSYKTRVEKKSKIERIKKNAKTLEEYLKKNSKDKHINEDLKPMVRSLVSAIDYETGIRASAGMEMTDEELKLLNTSAEVIAGIRDEQKLLNSLYQVQKTLERVEFYGLGIEGEIENLVAYLEEMRESYQYPKMVLNALELEHLETVDKLVRAVKSVVMYSNKLHTIKRNLGLDELGAEIVSFLDKLGIGKVYIDTINKYSKVFKWVNAVPYYAFNRLGNGGKILFGSLQDGWDKLAFNVKVIFDFTDATYTRKEVEEWSKDIMEVIINGKAYKMTTTQIMSFYCLSKREQAMKHILGNGIRIANFKDGMKVVNQPVDVKVTEEDVKYIKSLLTPRQEEVANKLQEFMNTTCADWGNYVSMERFGYKAFGEDNYFPIEVNDNNLSKDKIKDNKNVSLYALLNMGFTKSLNEKSKNAIMVNDIFDVFANHSSEMAKYNALGLAVLDFNKVMNYSEVRNDNPYSIRTAMEVAYGKDAEAYFNKLIADLNGTQNVSRDVLGKGFMGRAKLGAIGFNVKTVLLQPTAYFKASAILKKRYLSNPIVASPKMVKRGVERAKKYCGIALWKSMGFYDTNISRGVVEQIKKQESLFDKLAEKSTKGMEKADELTWGALWNACELEVKDTRKDIKVGSDEYFKVVAERLREVIYATQVVDSTLTRSEMMRSGDNMDKLLTAFGSEPILAYNMLLDCVMEHDILKRSGASKEKMQEHKRKTRNVLVAYTSTNLVVAIIETIISSLRDEDELEEDEAIKKFIESFASNMSIIGKIPYLKDVVSIFQGYSASRMDTQGFTSLYYTFNSFIKNLQGEGSAFTTYKHLMKAISSFSGLGLWNAFRDLMAMLYQLDIFSSEELEEMLNDIFIN